MTYEEFLGRAREASPRKSFAGELRQLYVDNGTLQVLVLMMLQQRSDLIEALAARPMLSEADIRASIGVQGQVNGIDVILQSIHAAMTEEEDDEVSYNDRAASP